MSPKMKGSNAGSNQDGNIYNILIEHFDSEGTYTAHSFHPNLTSRDFRGTLTRGVIENEDLFKSNRILTIWNSDMNISEDFVTDNVNCYWRRETRDGKETPCRIEDLRIYPGSTDFKFLMYPGNMDSLRGAVSGLTRYGQDNPTKKPITLWTRVSNWDAKLSPCIDTISYFFGPEDGLRKPDPGFKGIHMRERLAEQVNAEQSAFFFIGQAANHVPKGMPKIDPEFRRDTSYLQRASGPPRGKEMSTNWRSDGHTSRPTASAVEGTNIDSYYGPATGKSKPRKYIPLVQTTRKSSTNAWTSSQNTDDIKKSLFKETSRPSTQSAQNESLRRPKDPNGWTTVNGKGAAAHNMPAPRPCFHLRPLDPQDTGSAGSAKKHTGSSDVPEYPKLPQVQTERTGQPSKPTFLRTLKLHPSSVPSFQRHILANKDQNMDPRNEQSERSNRFQLRSSVNDPTSELRPALKSLPSGSMDTRGSPHHTAPQGSSFSKPGQETVVASDRPDVSTKAAANSLMNSEALDTVRNSQMSEGSGTTPWYLDAKFIKIAEDIEDCMSLDNVAPPSFTDMDQMITSIRNGTAQGEWLLARVRGG